MEKAFIKLYGDKLEHINTVPSIEIYHLYGWIPETVKFNEIPNKEHLWSRLLTNFYEKNIMIALGVEEKGKIEDSNELKSVLTHY